MLPWYIFGRVLCPKNKDEAVNPKLRCENCIHFEGYYECAGEYFVGCSFGEAD